MQIMTLRAAGMLMRPCMRGSRPTRWHNLTISSLKAVKHVNRFWICWIAFKTRPSKDSGRGLGFLIQRGRPLQSWHLVKNPWSMRAGSLSIDLSCCFYAGCAIWFSGQGKNNNATYSGVHRTVFDCARFHWLIGLMSYCLLRHHALRWWFGLQHHPHQQRVLGGESWAALDRRRWGVVSAFCGAFLMSWFWWLYLFLAKMRSFSKGSKGQAILQ